MKATTFKVEGQLLEELERAKPPSESLSAFVRSLLQKELVRRKMALAAERYAEFVRETPAERDSLAEWERADLDKPVRPRRR